MTQQVGQDAGRQAAQKTQTTAVATKPAAGADALPVPEGNPDVQVVEKAAEKPFWKFWQK